MIRTILCSITALVLAGACPLMARDWVRELQTKAIKDKRAEFGHWGTDPEKYTDWGSHSNRLIPVYTYGTKGSGSKVDLDSYTGPNSLYRNEAELKRLFGRVPGKTLVADAEYLDQTNIYDLQLAAAMAGKKHIFLVIFDGMDWVTTRAAAIHATQSIPYVEGRGTGLFWLDYTAQGTSQYHYMVTTPHNEGTDVDVDAQQVKNPGGKIGGGYDPLRAGKTPWGPVPQLEYLITKGPAGSNPHAYTDSSSSATSMTAGIKTFNGGVNVDYSGAPVETIAHKLQAQGWLVGAVSSVPISHATPAAAYAHNVERDDYQDLTRDLLGLKSIMHPVEPLSGLDVLIGGGAGKVDLLGKGQGKNFVIGNGFLTSADAAAVDIRNGGKYVVAMRTPGVAGAQALQQAAEKAGSENHRLLGFYGVGLTGGHLPFATADGDYQPAPGRKDTFESYTPADLTENPTLADMTHSALTAIMRPGKKTWLMVEAGDVDWANHDNNWDTSIGAVKSGDAAVKVLADWVEKHSNWNESIMIVTSDHGHLPVLLKPDMLITPEGP